MAAILVLLVVVDTFLTGYELHRARMVKRDISVSLDSLHDLMVWRGRVDSRMRDVSTPAASWPAGDDWPDGTER